jgi:hypothetical protein
MIICIFRAVYCTNLSDWKVEKKEFRRKIKKYIQKGYIYRQRMKHNDEMVIFFVKKF